MSLTFEKEPCFFLCKLYNGYNFAIVSWDSPVYYLYMARRCSGALSKIDIFENST